jgi:hypothetical protein
MTGESQYGVNLYWLPPGAGGHSVRLNGRIFEGSGLENRPTNDLNHSALTVKAPEGEFVLRGRFPSGNVTTLCLCDC